MIPSLKGRVELCRWPERSRQSTSELVQREPHIGPASDPTWLLVRCERRDHRYALRVLVWEGIRDM